MSEVFLVLEASRSTNGIAHHRPHPLRSYLLTQPQDLPSNSTLESIW
jgi:hypothetical protein